jgi:hypothetical protein
MGRAFCYELGGREDDDDGYVRGRGRGNKGGNPCLLLIYCSSGYVLYIHFNMVSVVLPERYTRLKAEAEEQNTADMRRNTQLI